MNALTRPMLQTWHFIRRQIRDACIRADYPRYEREARRVHEAEADRRFDASQLERDIASIRATADREGRQLFDLDIHRTETALRTLRQAIERMSEQLALFQRPYREELDRLHAQKDALQGDRRKLSDEMKALQQQRSSAHARLRKAHGALDDARSSIDSWYSRSKRTPWLFGNGGQRIPNHSLFGQSFGDLHGHKSDREDACEEIGDSKSAISFIVAQQKLNRDKRDSNQAALDAVFDSIRAVMNDRQTMFDLKAQGIRAHRLEADLSTSRQQATALEVDLFRLQSDRRERVAQAEERLDLPSRVRALKDLQSENRRFLATFNEPAQAAARQRLHREWWIRQKGSWYDAWLHHD